jgi:hypothetical protein
MQHFSSPKWVVFPTPLPMGMLALERRIFSVSSARYDKQDKNKFTLLK